MNRPVLYFAFLLILGFSLSTVGYGQESIFTGLKSDIRRADNHYNIGMYQNALDLYLALEKKGKREDSIKLKIAKSYFQLKEYNSAIYWFEKYQEDSSKLSKNDILNYAEALTSSQKYKKAIEVYTNYLIRYPENEYVSEKIWRLSNIQYLWEDSIFYTVKPARIPIQGTKYCPVNYDSGLVFIGDKKQIGWIKNHIGFENSSFKTLYFTPIRIDSIENKAIYSYGQPIEFTHTIESRFNLGPATFFANEDKMIYARNGTYNKDKGSSLGLYIAKKIDNRWDETEALPFNSNDYSVSNPSLNAEGNILYFSSNMPGGYGGEDLYVSYFSGNTWSAPVNLGKNINTAGNETYPLIHGRILYFASDGHGGMGGLDIFKVNTLSLKNGEIVNVGYPLNTSFDDFGITLNNDGTKGYISSNRINGGLEDAIFEIEIDIQTYPLLISGKVKYKKLEWRGTEKFELLRNASLSLIDAVRQIEVGTSKTDSLGNFEILIPYASKYVLNIEEINLGQLTVSLEIPKNKDPEAKHDIVVVENKNDTIELEQDSNEPKKDSNINFEER